VIPPVTKPSHAVFLSYASQDAEPAQRICEALRAVGIEVWFDQSELRGGEAWDRQIRRQIHDCALFIPVISANAHARVEGYFRLEWKLAVDRSHLIAPDQTFLLPVVIDDTTQADERIPDRFRELQWTRAAGGQASAAFIERVQRLLSPAPADEPMERTRAPAVSATPAARQLMRGPRRAKPVLGVTVAVVVCAALAYLVADRFRVSRHPSTSTGDTASRVTAEPAAAAFNPPPHSIAVLPFVNMSGDKEQEYFSDGLTEELLNSLSRINALQVAARTSAFSFKGKDTDIRTIAHELNVGAVLEGSVRRSGHTIRITTQLINAVTGFHLWSETYDRDLGDVLKLQTEIATTVASALKVTLIGDEAVNIEVGGTHNPAAFDAYLRAEKTLWGGYSPKVIETALAGYTEAIRLDPDFALAFAARALAFASNAKLWDTTTSAVRADLAKAQADAAKAIALAPNLSEGYLARAVAYQELLEFKGASEEYERALVLAPGNARVLRDYGAFAVYMGRGDSGLTAVRRAVALDPLNSSAQGFLGQALFGLRRYPEAVAAYNDAEALPSTTPGAFLGAIGFAYYLRGDFESARSICEQRRQDLDSQSCLAMTYDKLGRHSDAQAMLAQMRATGGETSAVTYAAVYAQLGNGAKALERLEAALRLRDPDLVRLKTEPLLDPLRKEPRFQAIERELKFPS
jgi:TolB-like protein/tetratricopeptide (TPR) repeat protein